MEKSVLADYKKAGSIVSEALAYGGKLVKPGANILQTMVAVEDKIRALGGQPAFPAQPSIDNIAAHYCPDPDDERVFEEGQLVKLDIGVHINGRVADTAMSIDLSDDKRHADLITAAQKARDAALKEMKPGTELGEIGLIIQNEIQDAGFSPIKNLSGHGLDDYEVHTTPTIPNFDTGDGTELEEDMVCAVEPFATTGQGKIFEQDHGNIYQFIQKRPVRGQFARQALKHINQYEGLPFCLHWLAKKMGTAQAKYAMRELEQLEIVETYPPLPEVSGAIVSQAEHSVIVKDKPIVYTRA